MQRMNSFRNIFIYFILLFIFTGCSPRLDSADYRERIKAVKRLKDQTLLIKVALEDKDRSVRHASILKIKDQKILTQISLKDKSWNNRNEAIGKLKDVQVLTKISEEDPNSMVRKKAENIITEIHIQEISQTNDTKKLITIISKEKKQKVRAAAIKRYSELAEYKKCQNEF